MVYRMNYGIQDELWYIGLIMVYKMNYSMEDDLLA